MIQVSKALQLTRQHIINQLNYKIMNKQEIYNMVANMRSNMLVFNDTVYYVSYDMDTNELFAGTATNCGIAKEYLIQYDPDMNLDYNLEGLVDLMNEDPINWGLDD